MAEYILYKKPLSQKSSLSKNTKKSPWAKETPLFRAALTPEFACL